MFRLAKHRRQLDPGPRGYELSLGGSDGFGKPFSFRLEAEYRDQR
jgi:hypothetical protein